MSRLKAVILIIVAAPLLIYGGIKGYAYVVIRGQWETMVRKASPFAEIRYGGIGSSFDGTVRVEQIRLIPYGVSEVIRIDAFELYTPGLLFLLRDAKSHWRKGLPERLGAAIQGLHLPLDGPIMAGLMSRGKGLSLGTSARVGGLACGWRSLFTPEDIANLGYTSLTYDADLLLSIPGNADELVLRFNARAHNLQRLYLEARLAGVVDTLGGGDTIGPRMRTLSMRYGLDPNYVRKAVEKCARESDLSVDTLLERLAGQDDAEYVADVGFVPGPGIRRALISFFRDPREIRVTAKPTWAVDLGTLDSYRPQDLPERLNLSVSLDKEEISDLSVRFTTASLRDKDGRGHVSPASLATAPAISAPGRKIPSKDRRGSDIILRRGVSYQRVDKEQLPELVGRDIWVSTRKGLERQGRLVKVADGIIWLTLRMRGGSMTTRVALTDTAQLGLRKTRR